MGKLGGRDIVTAGHIDKSMFYVKQVTKGMLPLYPKLVANMRRAITPLEEGWLCEAAGVNRHHGLRNMMQNMMLAMLRSVWCADDIKATFSRSSGPGGQNVNKVSTKADIRFDVVNCGWMSPVLKQAVMKREVGRMNKQVCHGLAPPPAGLQGSSPPVPRSRCGSASTCRCATSTAVGATLGNAKGRKYLMVRLGCAGRAPHQ
jgi:hypothetical protein